MGGELAGLVVATPSGGRHIYYAAPEPIKTGAGKLASGIDTRGPDGYAVAPGSVVDGIAYEIIEDSGIRPLPAFVAKIVGTRAARAAPVTTYAVEPDQPRNVVRFIEACKRAPSAVAGNWHELLPGFGLRGRALRRVG